jgi:hypothetical protein
MNDSPVDCQNRQVACGNFCDTSRSETMWWDPFSANKTFPDEFREGFVFLRKPVKFRA